MPIRHQTQINKRFIYTPAIRMTLINLCWKYLLFMYGMFWCDCFGFARTHTDTIWSCWFWHCNTTVNIELLFVYDFEFENSIAPKPHSFFQPVLNYCLSRVKLVTVLWLIDMKRIDNDFIIDKEFQSPVLTIHIYVILTICLYCPKM